MPILVAQKIEKRKRKKKRNNKTQPGLIGAALAASFAVDVVVFEFLAAAAAAVSK
jgi:hypothetical protein